MTTGHTEQAAPLCGRCMKPVPCGCYSDEAHLGLPFPSEPDVILAAWREHCRSLHALVGPAMTVEYAVQCADGMIFTASEGELDAHSTRKSFDTFAPMGHPHSDCGPHRVVHRYVTPWQEEDGQ